MGRKFFALLTAILTCCLSPIAAGAADIPSAVDFQQHGRQAAANRTPILVVFTLPDCPYCDVALRDYLVPMARSERYRGRVTIYEVRMDADRRLTDFSGRPTSHAGFARRHRVKVAPTVQLFTPDGAPAGPAVVGITLPDFYSAYLDQAIDQALTRVRGGDLRISRAGP